MNQSCKFWRLQIEVERVVRHLALPCFRWFHRQMHLVVIGKSGSSESTTACCWFFQTTFAAWWWSEKQAVNNSETFSSFVEWRRINYPDSRCSELGRSSRDRWSWREFWQVWRLMNYVMSWWICGWWYCWGSGGNQRHGDVGVYIAAFRALCGESLCPVCCMILNYPVHYLGEIE